MADNDNSKKLNAREEPINAVSSLVNNSNTVIRGVSDSAVSEVEDILRKKSEFETRSDKQAMDQKAADIIAQYGQNSEQARAAASEIIAKRSTHVAGVYRDTVNRLETVSSVQNIKKSVATLARSEKIKSAVFSEFGKEVSNVNGQQTFEYGESAHIPSGVLEQLEQQSVYSARESGISAKQSVEMVAAGGLELMEGNQVRSDVLGPASRHQSQMLSASAYRAGRQRQHEVGMSDMQRLKTNQEMQQEYLKKEESYAFKKEVREKVSSGSFDMDKAVAELSAAMKKAADATNDWKEAAEAATKATDDNREALVKEAVRLSKEQVTAQKEADKKQAEVDLARRQGMDDPTRRISGLQAGAGAFSTVADGLAVSMIHQPIADIRQKAMIGHAMVGRYEMGESALGGNMHSLLQIQGLKAVDEQARYYGNLQKAATIGDIGASTADAIAKKTVIAAGTGGNLLKTFVAGGGVEVYNDVAGLAKDVVGIGNKITAGLNKIPETDVEQQVQAGMSSANAAQTAIPAKILQRVYDQAMAAGDAVMGLGSGAQAEYAALTNQENIDRMANFGVSSTQYAAYTGMAAQMVGGSESASQVAERAAEIQSRNIMSGQAFIQNAGTLASVGGKTSDLYEIMKTATAAGMDNSKNITQMVQATATLSEDLARSGVSDTGSINSMLGGLVQQLVKSGVDKNMATPLAAEAIQKQSQFFTSQDINYGNVVEAMMIKDALPDATELQVAAIASLSPTELKTLAQRDKKTGRPTKAATQLSETIGIDNVFEKNLKLFEMGGAIPNAGMTGANLTQYDLGLFGTDERSKKTMRYLKKTGPVDATDIFKEGEQSDLGGQMTDKQKVEQIQAKHAADVLKSAGNFNAAMDSVVEKLKEVAKDLDPVKSQEKVEQAMLTKNMAEIFTKSGENLKAGSDALLNVSKKLEHTIDTISGIQGLKEALGHLNKGDQAAAIASVQNLSKKMRPK